MVAPLIGIALSLASQFAPGIVRHLAGDNAASVAETVISAAQEITGAGTPEDAEAALAANQELAVQFRTRMAELDLQETRAYLADVSNARGMTSDLAKAKHGAAWSSSIISGIVVIGFFIMLYVVMAVPLPEGSEPVAYLLLGALATGFQQVLSFWLGSSKGSKDKDGILSALTGGR